MTFSFKFEGDHHTFGRVVTGHYSLDHALAGGREGEIIGFPTRTLCEFESEGSGVGKTTFSLHILGKISKARDNLSIACAELEPQDESVVGNVLSNTGYSAPFYWINYPKNAKGSVDDRDEMLLQELLYKINDNPPCLGLLDSIASLSSMAEKEGDLGDANMGRRAYPMAQFVRRASKLLGKHDLESCIIMNNHLYEKMGAIGPAKQFTSPGGRVKEFERSLAIRLKIPYVEYISSGESRVKGEWQELGAWILEGEVRKNRAGRPGTKFQVFIYGGRCVHDGMTSLIDCLASGLAKIKAGKVVMDGTDYGLLKKIIEKERDNPDFFRPFYNELRASSVDSVLLEEE